MDLDGQIAVSWAAGMQIRLVKREQPQPWALQLYIAQLSAVPWGLLTQFHTVPL